MKIFVFRTFLTLTLLAFLSGCVGQLPSRGNVAQNTQISQSDEAPPPKAAPAEPVQSVFLPPQVVASAAPSPQAYGAPGSPQSAVSAAANAVKAKVAILLPLSGKNAAIGQAMLNAAQMAVFDMSGGNFELMPRDTGADGASAAAAARDAVGNGAQLLIGPLFGAQVPDVAVVAEQANISMLTLSTDTTLAASGVFVMGFTPGAQVDRVVNFAATRGAKRFAAIIPDNPYGVLVSQAFRVAVARSGGVVADLQTYDPVHHNADAAIATLVQYRDRIDALFLPEGGADLEKIAASLAQAGFDNRRVHLLGTGLWDDPGLGQRAAFAAGGWYAAPDPAARRNFLAMYARSYGQEPPRLVTLAYDATALAAVLARRGERFDRAALTNPNGFAGVDGIFRLTEQGLVERGLAVDEIGPGGNRVVAPAPVSFAAVRNF